jgi:hypothetical protein
VTKAADLPTCDTAKQRQANPSKNLGIEHHIQPGTIVATTLDDQFSTALYTF